MGKPAARIGDMHVCPMVTPGVPPIPHVGGPVIGPGAPTVLIGGMPAVTLGDMCTCVGPPDAIILGSVGVMIGGKPAARLGDSCSHGGTIVVGLPTVMIGEVMPGAFPFPIVTLPNGDILVGNNITIQGTPEFQQIVLRDLAIMAGTTAGLATLNNTNNGAFPMTVVSTAAGNSTVYDNPANTSNGVGTGSTINYNPTPRPTAANPAVNRPGDVALNHELNHANNASAGNANFAPDPANPNNPHHDETTVINADNNYRRERGVPTRADHTVL